MTTRPSGDRRARGFGWLRGRLTFANVTALTALFVALGGSSYAAMRVGSEEIANNSVRGKDIRKGTVRGTDVRDGDLKGKDVRDRTISGADVKESSLGSVPSADLAASAANAAALGGKPASAFLGSDKQVRTGLIRLALGQTKTVISSGPFTWRASCTAGAGADPLLTVTLSTTQAAYFAGAFNGSTGGAVAPGAPATVFDSSQGAPGPAPAYSIAFPLSVVSASGAGPAGIAFVGLNVAGAACVVNGILWP